MSICLREQPLKKEGQTRKLSIFLKKSKMLTIYSHFCVRFAIIPCYYKDVPNERRALWWMFQELVQVTKAKTHYIKVARRRAPGLFLSASSRPAFLASLTLSALRLLESGRNFFCRTHRVSFRLDFLGLCQSRRTAARNKNKQAKRTVFTRSFLLAKCH